MSIKYTIYIIYTDCSGLQGLKPMNNCGHANNNILISKQEVCDNKMQLSRLMAKCKQTNKTKYKLMRVFISVYVTLMWYKY